MMLPAGSRAVPASLWVTGWKGALFRQRRRNAGGSDGAGVRGKNQSSKGAPPFSFPVSLSTLTQMPANPQYDDATLAAITAYFRVFCKPAKP